MAGHTALDRDRAHLLHPLHHPSAYENARVWVSGEGAILTDSNGREYIDGLSGLWNVNVGHGRKELGEAARAQMDTLAFTSAYAGGTNERAIELADKLSALVYPSINTFFFTSGGAEASETSFKTARFYWKAAGKPGKFKVISRMRAYHGLTLAAMSATGLPAFWPMFEPRTPGFSHIDAPDPYRFVHSDSAVSLGIAAANKLEEAILAEGPDTVAAFIAEPVQGAGGVIVPPDDYFERIRAICTRYDVLLIADEVITGFGRTGRWFGLERYGVEPDIIQFAKGITSGYIPLGGIGVSDRVREAIDSVPPGKRWMHAFTLLRPPDVLCRGPEEHRHPRTRGAGRSGCEKRRADARETPRAGIAGRRRQRARPRHDGGGRSGRRQGDEAVVPGGDRHGAEADRRVARSRPLHARGDGLHLRRAAPRHHRRANRSHRLDHRRNRDRGRERSPQPEAVSVSG